MAVYTGRISAVWGQLFSEDYYIISLTDAPEYAAVRVAPLDEQCRELNRRYIQPVGYACNNLFLVNWDETDFAKLDLNDLFDCFYPMVSDKPSPYVLDENPNEGTVYRISEKEFEHVVQAYLNINRAVLQSKAGYVPEEKFICTGQEACMKRSARTSLLLR